MSGFGKAGLQSRHAIQLDGFGRRGEAKLAEASFNAASARKFLAEAAFNTAAACHSVFLTPSLSVRQLTDRAWSRAAGPGEGALCGTTQAVPIRKPQPLNYADFHNQALASLPLNFHLWPGFRYRDVLNYLDIFV